MPKYLQLWEALDRPPTEQEFGAQSFNWPWPGGVDEGWPRFTQAINDALAAAERHFAAAAKGSSTLTPTPAPPAPVEQPGKAEEERKGLRRFFRWD